MDKVEVIPTIIDENEKMRLFELANKPTSRIELQKEIFDRHISSLENAIPKDLPKNLPSGKMLNVCKPSHDS